MPESSSSASVSAVPQVSIILPTYNREKFLPEALEAIANQTLTDWELIIVDDGSTDGTRELIPRLTEGFQQPVRYIYQENQGAYAARNTGLDHAKGEFIAFYDSDDLWYPCHLANCLLGLRKNPEVDWAFAACRIVTDDPLRVVRESTFRHNGKPRRFLQLRCRDQDGFRIIDDPRLIKVMLKEGIFCGLQNSVIKASVFSEYRFNTIYGNEAEDVLFTIKSIDEGRIFGYIDEVHVDYRIHSENATDPGGTSCQNKSLSMHMAIANGMEAVIEANEFVSKQTMRGLRKSLANKYFWQIGYSILWRSGRHAEALEMLWRGMYYNRLCMRYWKTYVACRARKLIHDIRCSY